MQDIINNTWKGMAINLMVATIYGRIARPPLIWNSHFLMEWNTLSAHSSVCTWNSGQAYSNHEACFIFSMLRFRLEILATIIKVSKPLEWNAEKKFFKLHKNGPYADIEFKMQSNVFLGGFCQIPHIPRRVFKTFNTKKITFFRNLCYEI